MPIVKVASGEGAIYRPLGDNFEINIHRLSAEIIVNGVSMVHFRQKTNSAVHIYSDTGDAICTHHFDAEENGSGEDDLLVCLRPHLSGIFIAEKGFTIFYPESDVSALTAKKDLSICDFCSPKSWRREFPPEAIEAKEYAQILKQYLAGDSFKNLVKDKAGEKYFPYIKRLI